MFNGELYFEVAGSGKPVLFIHAGVADCRMWDAQFTLFSQYYRVIRYDMRSYGKSHTETTEFSNRQDIVDLFKFLQVEQASLIGISRGGQIAIDFTLEHPEYVSALIPVAAGVSGFDHPPDDSEKARHEFELFTHMDELWEKNAFDELAEFGSGIVGQMGHPNQLGALPQKSGIILNRLSGQITFVRMEKPLPNL